MNIKECLDNAMKDGMDRLAYSLMWVVQQGYNVMTDSVEAVELGAVNHEEVSMMMKQDLLGIQQIQLYSMPLINKSFMFVLADNEADAKGLYLKRVKSLPTRVDDISVNLDMEVWSDDAGGQIIREFKDSAYDFPCHIFDYQKE